MLKIPLLIYIKNAKKTTIDLHKKTYYLLNGLIYVLKRKQILYLNVC